MNDLISRLKTFHSDGFLSISGEFLVVSSLGSAEFFNVFPKATYSSSSYDSVNKEGTVRYSDLKIIFDDYYDLLKSIFRTDCRSELKEVFIISKMTFIDIDVFSNRLIGWLDFFQTVADHSYDIESKPYNKAYVIIEKNSSSGRSSAVLSFEIGSLSIYEIENSIESISDPSALIQSCAQNDAHQGEKISIMKTSIVQLIDKSDLNFYKFINSADLLLKNFHKNYETYLRSFSFDSFVKDLEDDVGSFISKVEEQIQGFYMQSLAVPGAVILGSAFRGAEKGISLALVFSTLLAIIIVFKSLKSKIDFITRIHTNALAKLDIYQRRTLDISNDYAKEAISEKIVKFISLVNDAKDSGINNIGRLRDTLIILISLYVVASIVFWRF